MLVSPSVHLSLCTLLFIGLAKAEPPDQAAPWGDIVPALEATCYDCHSTRKHKGGVDLEQFQNDPKFEAEFALWDKVREVVAEGSMPPENNDALLPEEKTSLISWIDHSMKIVAAKNAGDPGPVTLRRLTNVEYDRTITELTGQHYDLAEAFQPDGGGGEGFSNIGDVLFMSPQQLDKYLSAARTLSEHATILPGTGVIFQPQRVGLRSFVQMRDQAEQSLYVWYQKMAAPLIPSDTDDMREADYMRACWKWKHRQLTGASSLAKLAADEKLFLPFLENWWHFLTEKTFASRFLDLTRLPWQNLPGPDAAKPQQVPPVVEQQLLAIQDQRRAWYAGAERGQSTVQRQQQDADGLRAYGMSTTVKGHDSVHICIGDVGDGNTGDWVLLSNFQVELPEGRINYQKWLSQEIATLRKGSTDSGKAARLKNLISIMTQFGQHPQQRSLPVDQIALQAPAVVTLPLPPNAVRISVTGQLDMANPGIEHATVQWRLATDTPPAVDQILPGIRVVYQRQAEGQKRVMDDYGRMKALFPDIYDRRLEEVARNYQRGGKGYGIYYLSDSQLAASLKPNDKRLLEGMTIDWKFLSLKKFDDGQLKQWDQHLLKHLHSLAQRAWRRPLTAEEQQQLAALYYVGLKTEMGRETAAREVLVRIFISPHFLYKAETLPPLADAPPTENAAPSIVPLNSWQLASRLSYFLWASAPDWVLRQAAADGSLMTPEGLRTQTLRMLKDPRSDALASEFAGQWLEFAGFAENTQMDTEKFPDFTPELRDAMDTETRLFFEALIRQDRPVTDIVLADYTYLNQDLAQHYGIPGVHGPDFQQVSVKGHPRGGLLAMGSVLAKTSRPHRTSPVLRGNWLLNAVLGTPVPPPPNDVPEIEEHPDVPRSLREQLELHRKSAACASCHNRIDPLGFALEQFDPIGRVRQLDDLGKPIDTSASLPNGAAFSGFDGLRTYLSSRQDLFLKLFCRKITGYALGREVILSDATLMDEMKRQLKQNDLHFSAAVLTLVESQQFKNRRAQ